MVPSGGDDGFQIVSDLLPPVDKDPGALKLVQYLWRDEFILQSGEQFLANLGHLLAPIAGVAQFGKIILGNSPP